MNADMKNIVPETKNGSRLARGAANEEWLKKRRRFQNGIELLLQL
jgi:hypothetical protein